MYYPLNCLDEEEELKKVYFNSAAQDIYNQINKQLTSSRFLIYGHSLGTYLALRVSNMLKKTNKYPDYLILTGNCGPGVGCNKIRYSLEQKDFIEELKTIGGIPKELIENQELFNFFEPILRADFEVAEKNGLDMELPVDTPIYAIMGNQEEEVEKISNWAKYTCSDFAFEILEGDHFFIYKHPQKIADIINNCYDKVTLMQY
jgi:external thioesterase TEII